MTGNVRRWPRAVYGVGDEPDPRFTLANERTFLAWSRTAMALLAGGVAIAAVDLSINGTLKSALAVALIGLGGACAAVSWWRWACAERALRLGGPLPAPLLAALLALSLAVIAGVLIALLVLR